MISPFARLARTHAANAMADAMVAASLAGSLFFSMPAGEARVPVLRYLVITMLPFAVLSPLIGPLIDRMKGGHRLMVIASLGLRAIAAWLMAGVVNAGNLTFFLYALLLLVFQKAYAVARSALVPTVVRTADELVQANSKLALISGLASALGVVPAGIVMKLAGPEWSLYLALCTYVVGAVLAARIKPVRVADDDGPDETERIELRGATIVMAGSAMGLIRGCVGFLTLLVAFDFQGGGRPTWQFGVVGGCSVISQLAGAAAGPRIRKITSEENLLTGVLALVVAGGLLSILAGGWVGATILGSCVGFAGGGGKLAFDSILQRDAPDANRGRAFARFETRFQVTWVVGALLPVAFDLDASTGFVVVFVTALIAFGSYVLARMSYAHRTGAKQTIATARAAEIEGRMSEVSAEVKGRLSRAPRRAIGRLRRSGQLDDDEYEYDEYGYDDEYEYEYEAYDDDEAYDEHDDDPEEVAPFDQFDDGHDDYDEEAPPAWADDASPIDPVAPTEHAPTRAAGRRGRRRGRPSAPDEVPPGAVIEADLAASSPVAWVPDDDDEEFPWAPPVDEAGDRSAYLGDLDESVDNPFPWTPDDPTRPD